MQIGLFHINHSDMNTQFTVLHNIDILRVRSHYISGIECLLYLAILRERERERVAFSVYHVNQSVCFVQQQTGLIRLLDTKVYTYNR